MNGPTGYNLRYVIRTLDVKDDIQVKLRVSPSDFEVADRLGYHLSTLGFWDVELWHSGRLVKEYL